MSGRVSYRFDQVCQDSSEGEKPTSASADPMILTSLALSSLFCSLSGGASCHTPLTKTEVPVVKLG